MSMTIYPIVGAAQTVTQSDALSASGVATAGSGAVPSDSFGGQVVVSQDRSVTKAGATRVMIKTALTTPSLSDPSHDVIGTLTLHTVLTVPKALASALVYEQTGLAQMKAIMNSIVWLTALQTALINGTKSIPTLPSVTSDLPLIKGILAGLPLNLFAGTYGAAS